jgi:hypothetical protein
MGSVIIAPMLFFGLIFWFVGMRAFFKRAIG